MIGKITAALDLAYECGERAERMRIATQVVKMLEKDKETLTVDHPLMVLLAKLDSQAYDTISMLVMHRG